MEVQRGKQTILGRKIKRPSTKQTNKWWTTLQRMGKIRTQVEEQTEEHEAEKQPQGWVEILHKLCEAGGARTKSTQSL